MCLIQNTSDLSSIEEGKIKCGEAHFKALAAHEPAVRYTVARTIVDRWRANGAGARWRRMSRGRQQRQAERPRNKNTPPESQVGRKEF